MAWLLVIGSILLVLLSLGFERTVRGILISIAVLFLYAFSFGCGLLFSALFENFEPLRHYQPPSDWTYQYKWSMTAVGQSFVLILIAVAELLYWSLHIIFTVPLIGPKLGLAWFGFIIYYLGRAYWLISKSTQNYKGLGVH